MQDLKQQELLHNTGKNINWVMTLKNHLVLSCKFNILHSLAIYSLDIYLKTLVHMHKVQKYSGHCS